MNYFDGNGKRGLLDVTLAAMFSNVLYRDDYLFYAHIIGQCSIKIDHQLDAPAGVAFIVDHYNLYVNPDFFDKLELKQRLAVLKHEALHIIFGHVKRETKLKNHKRWNWAADCAINQLINKDHLKETFITPESLDKFLQIKVPLKRSSEEYYNLLHMIKEDNKIGFGKASNSGMDTHDKWGESIGDGDLQEDITKKMISKSEEETIKGNGTVPSECNKWLEMYTRKCEFNWKKILTGIVGNKKIGYRPTIMKNSRRFPNRPDLRGKIKNRIFNLLVISDVSGSMSDKNIIDTYGEIIHVCDVTKTSVDLIQVDSEAYAPEKLTKNIKLIKRKGVGGTTLFKGLEKAKECKIDYQAIVVLTDGELFGDDIDYFIETKKRVIWLIPNDGQILDKMNSGRMKAFKLKN
jgi:predicted metal-dependent peptidase